MIQKYLAKYLIWALADATLLLLSHVLHYIRSIKRFSILYFASTIALTRTVLARSRIRFETVERGLRFGGHAVAIFAAFRLLLCFLASLPFHSTVLEPNFYLEQTRQTWYNLVGLSNIRLSKLNKIRIFFFDLYIRECLRFYNSYFNIRKYYDLILSHINFFFNA